MKKKLTLFIFTIILISVTSCSEYKPIFSSPNIDFKIKDHKIKGDKKLGNQIYLKLYNLSLGTKNSAKTKNLSISINSSSNKEASAKDTAGKILSYRLNLSTEVKIKEYLSDKIILDKKFIFSSNYKVQDQYSETIKLENKSIESLIDKTYQDLLIIIIENIS